jgi:hypothetical protein
MYWRDLDKGNPMKYLKRLTVLAFLALVLASSAIQSALSQQPVSSKNDETAAVEYKVEEKSGVVPFANFLVDVNFEKSGQLELLGAVTLGDTSNGADVMKEHISISVGKFSLVIPAGSFQKTAKGELRFKKVTDCMYWDLHFRPAAKNKLEFKLELDAENKLPSVKAEHVAITIGDDGGRAKAYSK